MAFKPFDYFRKRQKFILASLAILSMFLFIVGDALTGRKSGGTGLLQRLFGRGEYIAVVEGHALDAQQLMALAQQRVGAYQLIAAVRDQGTTAALERANLSQADQQRLYMLQLGQNRFAGGRQSPNPLMWPRLVNAVLEPQSGFPLSEQDRKAFTEMQTKLADKGLLDSLLAQTTALISSSQLTHNPPFLTAEGLVEFILWQKKADELGIVMSPAKIVEDLIKVGAKAIKEDEIPRIAARANLKVDSDSLVKAIGEELRVMMARGVILGPTRPGPLAQYAAQMCFSDPSAMSVIHEPTPADLWDAYVKVKTELEVAILPVPVNSKDFLAQAREPTAEEAKDYYKQYKDQEPDPARETPGFRIPKKYQIEFLYGELKNESSDTTKFYDTWVKVQDAVPAVLSRSLGDLLLPPRTLVDAAGRFQIDREFRYTEQQPYVTVPAGAKPEDADYYRAPIPATGEAWPTAATIERARTDKIASAAGTVALVFQSPLTALAQVAELSKNRIEKMSRAHALSIDVASLTANASQGLAGLLVFPPHVVTSVKYHTFAEERNSIVDELMQERRASLMESDLVQLKNELEEYAKSDEFKKKLQDWRGERGKAEKAGKPVPPFEPPPMPSEEYRQKYKEWKEAKAKAESELKKKEVAKFQPPPPGEKENQKPIPIKEYLERYAKPRGLVLTGMKEPRAKFDLLKESGDTPIGTLLKPIFLGMYRDQYSEPTMVQELTSQKGWYEAREIKGPMGNKPREFALYWRSFETDARTPPLAECEATVREAWKLNKARVTADEAAKAIANDKEVKGAPDGYRKLLDIDNKQFGNSYTEQRLARYELADRFHLGGMVNYTRSKPSSYFEYPPDDLIDRALEGLQKAGDTLVIANKPKSRYYVLFCIKRTQPRANEEIWVRQFDQEVIYPDTSRQLQVENLPLARWVTRKDSEQFQKDWDQYVKAVTKFDSDKAARLKSFLENLARGQGGGEEF